MIALGSLDFLAVRFRCLDFLGHRFRVQEIVARQEPSAHRQELRIFSGERRIFLCLHQIFLRHPAGLRAAVLLDFFLDVVRREPRSIHGLAAIMLEVDFARRPGPAQELTHLREGNVRHSRQKNMSMLASAILEILKDRDVLAGNALLLVPTAQRAHHLAIVHAKVFLGHVPFQCERDIPIASLEVIHDETSEAFGPESQVDLLLRLTRTQSRPRSSLLTDALLLRHHSLRMVLIDHHELPVVGYPSSSHVSHLLLLLLFFLLFLLFCIFILESVEVLIPLPRRAEGIAPSKNFPALFSFRYPCDTIGGTDHETDDNLYLIRDAVRGHLLFLCCKQGNHFLSF